MARKRINVKFVVIGSGILVTAVAGGFVARRMLHTAGDPKQWEAQGDDLARTGNFPEAADFYRRVLAVEPKNAEVHLRLAKTTYQMGEGSAGESLDEFTKTEELDPANKAAWTGVLEGYMRYLTYLEGRPARRDEEEGLINKISDARDAAAHLLALDPNDPTAIAAVPVIDLRMWMMRFAVPLTPEERKLPVAQQPTDQQKADQAMLNLTELLKRHSANEQIPYWLARAKIFEGDQLQRSTNRDAVNTAAPLFAEAASVFDDAIAANPNAIKLYLRKAEILARLRQVDQSAEPQAEYKKQYRDCVDHAQQLADIKTSREDYYNAKYAFAGCIAETDPGRAETLFNDLIKQFPEVPQLSISLARMLRRDPTRIQSAIDVLDKVPSVAPPSFQTPEKIRYWDTEYAENRLERANIQIDQMERMPPSQARHAKGEEIEKALAAAATRFDGRPEYLLALGRYQLATEHVRDAITTLSTGQERLNALGQRQPEMMINLARAYQMAAQPTEAMNLYRTAIQNDPIQANNLDVRMRLAQCLLQARSYEQARVQIDWLSKRVQENDPAFVQLELAGLGPVPDPKDVSNLIAKLPEKTENDLKTKIAVSVKYKDVPDMVRACRQLVAAEPNDPLVEQQLVRALAAGSQVSDAETELASGMQKFPDDQGLKDLKHLLDALTGKTPAGETPNVEEAYAKQLALVQKIEDPFTREVRWADLDQRFGRTDEEIDHSQKAVAIQPDSIDATQTLFFRYIAARQFTEASAMLPHLTDINADQAHGNILRVKLALAEGDATQAVTVARQLVEDNPDYWICFQTLGDAYRMSGQYDLAVQQYMIAWQKQPANPEVIQALIYCDVNQNKVADARRVIAQAIKLFPEDPSYLSIQVLFECKHGNPEPLLPQLEAAMNKSPASQVGYTLYCDALRATYQLHVDRGETTDAQPFLDKLIATAKEAHKRWPDEISYAQGLADALINDKDFKGAEAAILETAGQPKWKDQPNGQYIVGEFYFSQKKYDQAEPFLRKTVELAPNSVSAHVALARNLWEQNKQEDALRVIKPAIAQSADAFRAYDQWLIQLGRGEQAESETNGALAANPKNPVLNDLLIEVYALNGKTQQAIDLANRVIHDDPRNVQAYQQLGLLQSSGPKRDLDSAIRNITVYRDARPDDPNGHVELGDLEKQKDDWEGAIHEYLVASQLSPQDRNVRLKLLDSYLNSPTDHKSQAQTLLTDLLKMQKFADDPDFLRTAATLWAQNGDNLKAIVAINKAVEQVRTNTEYEHDRDAVLTDLLHVLQLTKRNDQLVEEADKLLADPKTGPAMIWTAYSYRARGKAGLGDTAGAMEDFKIALDKSGTDPAQVAPVRIAQNVREQLGIDKAVELVKPRAENSLLWKLVMISLYQSAKDYNHADDYAELALKEDQTLDVSVQRNLTRAAANLAVLSNPPKYDRAAELYRKVLADAPDDVASMNDLATTLDDSPDQSKPAEALVWSTKAYDIMNKQGVFNARICDTQGWTLILNNKIDDGLDVLHKACDHANLPDAHYHLAKGYLKEKHPDDATRELLTAQKQLDDAVALGDTYDSSLHDKINAASVEATTMTQQMTQTPAQP